MIMFNGTHVQILVIILEFIERNVCIPKPVKFLSKSRKKNKEKQPIILRNKLIIYKIDGVLSTYIFVNIGMFSSKSIEI